LDGPTLDEPVLILMNELLDFGLMSVGQKFGDHLHDNIDEGDWHEVGYPNRIVNFRNQSDIGGVKTFRTQLIVEEVLEEIVEVTFDQMPTIFYKFPIEVVWARSSVDRHTLNNAIKFSRRERYDQGVKAFHMFN
jgi:hypothetical protein